MTSIVEVAAMVKDQDGKYLGRAFSETPPWLLEYINEGNMGIAPAPGINHAVWAVKTQKGIIVAEPGDKITRDDMFGIVVEKHNLNTITWEQIEPKDPNAKAEPVKPPVKRRAPRKKVAKSTAVEPAKKTTRAPRKARAKK